MRFILSVSLLLLCLSAKSQSFEGVIVYKNTYTSKVPQVGDEQFNAMLGTTQEYFVKGDGTFAEMQLYRQADNKLYSKFAISDTLY